MALKQGIDNQRIERVVDVAPTLASLLSKMYFDSGGQCLAALAGF